MTSPARRLAAAAVLALPTLSGCHSSSPAGGGDLTVDLAVSPGHAATTATAGFSASGDSATITITGSGADQAVWTASHRQSWTTLSAISGTGSGMLHWGRSTSGLGPGTYVDTITIQVAAASVSAMIYDTLQVLAYVPPPGSFTVTPTTTWAGGRITISGNDFTFRGDTAKLRIGGTSLALTRVDASTMAATLPTGLSGTVADSLLLDGYTVALPPLTLYGYDHTDDYTPQLGEDVYVWPRGAHARIMGGTGEGGQAAGLTFIDLDTRTVTSFADILNTGDLRGPGATFQDSVFLLRSATGPIEAWRVLPTPTLLESHPEVTSSRQAMRFDATHWFTSTSNSISYPGFAGGPGTANETEGVFMSPMHDRATITIDHIDGGIPVFTVPGGTLAYTVTQLTSAQGADFSADGTLLALVGGAGGQPQNPGRVLLLNATSGAVLGDTTLDRPAFAVAIDPVRSLLYVGVYGTDNHAVVLVLERSSFRRLGQLAVPASATACFLGCYKGVIALSDAPALYVFWGFNGASRAYRFTMPAGSGIFGP